MDTTGILNYSSQCKWCGLTHGAKCPEIKAIEFYEDGTIKRVELLTPADRKPTWAYPD